MNSRLRLDDGATPVVDTQGNWTATFSEAKVAYGETLVDLIDEGMPIVVVEADLMIASGGAVVMKAHPERVVQVGIAEQNAVGVGAGLADAGLIPFVNAFAVTLSRRAADQVWQSVAFSDMNVKLNGMYSGFTAEANGATHQSLEDIAIMRTFAKMVIMEPADCQELRQAVRVAAEHIGPVYLRNSRIALPDICDEAQPPFEIGKAVMLRPGDDVTIIAGGVMVQFALQAHDVLAAEGIGARVVNPRTIKPLDEQMVLRCAKETAAVVTIENHSIIGGLGGTVAEFLGRTWPTPLEFVGIHDKFGNSGTFSDLIQAYHMDVPDIVTAVKQVLATKAQFQGH